MNSSEVLLVTGTGIYNIMVAFMGFLSSIRNTHLILGKTSNSIRRLLYKILDPPNEVIEQEESSSLLRIAHAM